MKTLSQSRRDMAKVLPARAKWVKDSAAKFNLDANEVITKQGHIISYDFLVISIGLQLNYGKVTTILFWVNLFLLTFCNTIHQLNEHILI